MNDILTGLNEINGVIGSAIFDASDECVAHAIPAPYEPILLSQAMKEFRAVLEVMGSNEDAKDWAHMQVTLENGCVALRAVDDYTLMAIGSATLNHSMLSIGFSVASLKLSKAKGDGSISKSAGKSGAKSASKSGAVSATGGSQKSLSSMSFSPAADGPRVPNAVGPAVIDALYKLLAREVGPFAKMAVKEEMGKLGATPYTMVPSQFDDLVGALVRRVPLDKQKDFIAKARELVFKR